MYLRRQVTIFLILAYLHILLKNEKYAAVIRHVWTLDRPVRNLRLIRQIREFFKIIVAFFSQKGSIFRKRRSKRIFALMKYRL